MNPLRPLIGPFVRALLTIVSGIFIARGLPELTEQTISNLGDIIVAAVTMLGVGIWAWKAKKPQD